MRAIITWLTKEQGGRLRPPVGVGLPPYATVVRFVDCEEAWPPRIAWSLVVEKEEALSQEYIWLANVRYLVKEAPHESLTPGREFELFEGNRLVARGRLVEDRDAVVGKT